jgi:hypothetical protein
MTFSKLGLALFAKRVRVFSRLTATSDPRNSRAPHLDSTTNKSKPVIARSRRVVRVLEDAPREACGSERLARVTNLRQCRAPGVIGWYVTQGGFSLVLRQESAYPAFPGADLTLQELSGGIRDEHGDNFAVILVGLGQELVVIKMLADVVKTKGHGEPAILVVYPAVEHFTRSTRNGRPNFAGSALRQVGILRPLMS